MEICGGVTMANYKVITTQALIEKFQYALDSKWGYIIGRAGTTWTQKDQDNVLSLMKSKYGDEWKKNTDAKNDKYYYAALYGQKWVGKKVADCSGLFAWAFNQLGSYMYHGSNTMYREYCTEKGKLNDSLKKTLQPGIAVFTGSSEKDHPHVGLYVGNGKVIEASGTQAGVCMSNITAGKWTYWGKLKYVDYSTENAPISPSVPSDDKILYPTLKMGNKGEKVAILQQLLIDRGYKLPRYGADGDFGAETESAVKQYQKDHGLKVDGIAGEKTWTSLMGEAPAPVVKYTVTLKGITDEQLNQLKKQFTDISYTKE